MSEDFIGILIFIHASLGGLALLSGLVALATPKGTNPHRVGGKVFYYSMLAAALTAMVIALLPGHVNYFLFAIGIFSMYMILSGRRVLHLKQLYKGVKPAATEFILPGGMLISAVFMIGFGIYLYMYVNQAGIVLTVFGGIALFLSFDDLRLLRSQPTDKRFWLYQHITKMTGGYIAATTAFIVVNGFLPGIWGWLTPTVIGSAYITYFQTRFRQRGEKILANRNIEQV